MTVSYRDDTASCRSGKVGRHGRVPLTETARGRGDRDGRCFDEFEIAGTQPVVRGCRGSEVIPSTTTPTCRAGRPGPISAVSGTDLRAGLMRARAARGSQPRDRGSGRRVERVGSRAARTAGSAPVASRIASAIAHNRISITNGRAGEPGFARTSVPARERREQREQGELEDQNSERGPSALGSAASASCEKSAPAA